jgi:redox-sensitive bicupin YhaK (pirin superfamily)
MKTLIHTADSRGSVDFGWLKSKHTFSFGSYHNESRTNFGALRVLNDDHVTGGAGFGTHPHRNMEIISIPLQGVMEHKDSMQNIATLEPGKIQVMSAGSGVTHSEYNKSATEDLKFLQIWLVPNKQNVAPRYDEFVMDYSKMKNQFLQILSPNPDENGVWVHQNAWFHMADIDKEHSLEYNLKNIAHGVYVFVLEGELEVNDRELNHRDGAGFWETISLTFKAKKQTRVLLMEVPFLD